MIFQPIARVKKDSPIGALQGIRELFILRRRALNFRWFIATKFWFCCSYPIFKIPQNTRRMVVFKYEKVSVSSSAFLQKKPSTKIWLDRKKEMQICRKDCIRLNWFINFKIESSGESNYLFWNIKTCISIGIILTV